MTRTYAAVTAITVALAIAIGLATGAPRFALDDPYITLHNAHALLAHTDANFPGVSPLVGTTSALHMLFTAALTSVFPTTWSLFVLEWAAIALYACGLAALAGAMKLESRERIVMVVLGLLVGRTPLQLVNGLETGLGMAVCTWLLALAVDDSPRARIAAAHLGGLAPFVRPELGALTATLAFVRWHALRREQPGSMNAIAVDAARIALTAAPWLLWYGLTTGHFFPQTTTAKIAWFAPSCRSRLAHVKLFLAAFGDFLRTAGPLHFGLFGLAYTVVGRAALAYVAIVLAAYLWLFPGGLLHNDGRYAYVLVPALLYGVASLAISARKDLRRIGRVVGVAMILFTLVLSPLRVAEYRGQRLRAAENDATAVFVRRSLPRDARVYVHDVGLLSTETSLRLVDMVGLKSPDAAAVHARMTGPSCGALRQRAIETIARQDRVTHLVAVRDWDELFGIREALTSRGWRVVPLRTSAGGYGVYELSPP